jgi:hypothetical protein
LRESSRTVQPRKSVTHEPEGVAHNLQGQANPSFTVWQEKLAEASENREEQAIKSMPPTARTVT